MLARRKRSPSRTLLYAVIILGVAGVVGWFGAKYETQRQKDVRLLTQRLCETFIDGREISWQRSVIDPAVANSVLNALQAVCQEIPPNNTSDLSIDVRSGDVAEYGNGQATHHAIINIRNDPRLGLRFAPQRDSESDQIFVIGYWYPDLR